MDSIEKYPTAFIERMKNKLGNEFPAFLNSLDKAPNTSVRINALKKNTSFDDCEKIAWSSTGKYLTERPLFTADPLFHAGTYYVQEASSMFIEEAVRQLNLSKNALVLDLCAAPGGKSTILASMFYPDGLVVCNEVIHSRIPVLKENIIKWGLPNTIITSNDSSEFATLKEHFDLVLCDAPCSGEGLFRKDKNAVNEWSENNVTICAARQKRILTDAIDLVKPGGFLIYTTCTYSHEENEQNADFISSKDMDSKKLSISDNWKIIENDVNGIFSYSFYPHKIKGEGFFISCFQKPGNSNFHEINNKKKKENIHKNALEKITEYINIDNSLTVNIENNKIYILCENQHYKYNLLNKKLNIKHFGLFAGEIKNNEFIPSHDLAMSVLCSNNIRKLELDLSATLNYLKKEAIACPDKNIKGWLLLTYNGVNLGWGKAVSGRINNYYPKEYRIRMNLNR